MLNHAWYGYISLGQDSSAQIRAVQDRTCYVSFDRLGQDRTGYSRLGHVSTD